MAITFWCAGCGQPLTAADTDAGRVVECVRCLAVVHVPRNIAPPVEHDRDRDDSVPPPREKSTAAFAADDSGPAVAGIRLITLSLILGLLGIAVVAAAAFGPGATRSLTRLAALLFSFGGLLRFIGYSRLFRVARLMQVDWAITCGMIGAPLFTIGLILVLWYRLVLGINPHADTISFLGLVAMVAGGLLEMGVVFFYHQLVLETTGAAAARQVYRYATLLGLALGATPFGIIGWMIMLPIITFIRKGVLGAIGLDFNTGLYSLEELIFFVIGGGVGFGLVFLICRNYYQILARSRAGLAAARRDPEPLPS